MEAVKELYEVTQLDAVGWVGGRPGVRAEIWSSEVFRSPLFEYFLLISSGIWDGVSRGAIISGYLHLGGAALLDVVSGHDNTFSSKPYLYPNFVEVRVPTCPNMSQPHPQKPWVTR